MRSTLVVSLLAVLISCSNSGQPNDPAIHFRSRGLWRRLRCVPTRNIVGDLATR